MEEFSWAFNVAVIAHSKIREQSKGVTTFCVQSLAIELSSIMAFKPHFGVFQECWRRASDLRTKAQV